MQANETSKCVEDVAGPIAEATNIGPDDSIHSAGTTSEVAAVSKLPFRTALYLKNTTPKEVPWVIKPFVALGSVTEVAGQPKTAGKTTFILAGLEAVQRGGEFLGESTRRSRVMYLTEERETTWRAALDRADLLDSEDFIYLAWRDTLDMPWDQVIDEAIAECKRRHADVLVVDTLGQFARLAGDAENAAGHALEAYRPLQRAAAEGLAVIVVRHERKSGGDVANAGRGSNAFTGAADIVLVVRRPEGNARGSIREIHAVSRFDETPDLLVVDRTTTGYVARDRAAIAQDDAEAAILKAAPSTEAEAIELEALIKQTNVKRTTAQAAVTALIDAGRLKRVGKGVKRDPHRLYAPAVHSADTTGPNAAERMAVGTPVEPPSNRRYASWAAKDTREDSDAA